MNDKDIERILTIANRNIKAKHPQVSIKRYQVVYTLEALAEYKIMEGEKE